MNKIALILIFCIPITVFGQCKVTFLIDDRCIDSVYPARTEIALLDSIGTTIESPDGRFCLSPGLEAHVLISVIRSSKYMYLRWKFIVPEDKELTKIIRLPKLVKMNIDESVQSKKRYYYCNNLCSGFYMDYYDNGQIRMKGQFLEGKPLGKQYTYHRSGKTNYIAKYSSQGKFRRSKLYQYDEDGSLKEIVSYRNYVNFMIDLTPKQGGSYGFVGYDP
ncbi:hypothetical protein EYV94_28415 [Puteibacter caeruleilacunae]|nr:hypothetical protein EYV94_28415 [Puteibacter caeruleilacunae]